MFGECAKCIQIDELNNKSEHFLKHPIDLWNGYNLSILCMTYVVRGGPR